ncbi:MAG: hypothetical protein JJU02_14110 [Cryomorphaceae bacterium]|nr:hypothetical protein [Cryomorphaceae bacterium]
MTSFQKHSISVQKTARYHFRPAEGIVKAQWIIAHGYGQLTQYFSQKFADICVNHELIIPEGLHRFYLQGTDGRVGASWMTKEERETDIQDYLGYLNDLYKHHKKSSPLIAFGFSQGVATICRWIAQSKIRPDHLIIWAGVIPPDMDIEVWRKVYEEVPITIFVGTKDPYRTSFHDEMYQSLKEKSPNVNLIEFAGKHEVKPDILQNWIQEREW